MPQRDGRRADRAATSVPTLVAAIRSEEAFLRRSFGDRYDRYRRPVVGSPTRYRRWAGASAWHRRLRTASTARCAGLVLALLLLLWKTTYN